jgi:probable HAF family extracellular repeat protein
MRRCFRRPSALALLVAALGATSARADLQYTVTDLGTLGGTTSEAMALNDAGQVVGSSTLANGQTHAFLYSGGTMTDLGTLGGNFSQAAGINSAGQVVGQSTDANGNTRAFLSSGGGPMTDVGDLGGNYAAAFGINDAGTFVGSSYFTPTGSQQFAFVSSPTGLKSLGALGGPFSSANAINASGQIAGEANTPDADHAFLYSNGVMKDLGTLGGGSSAGRALNGLGVVVGSSDTANNAAIHAFVYSNGVMSDLGALVPGFDSFAYGINDAGQIVGLANGNPGEGNFAVVYTGGSVLKLDDLIQPGSPLDHLFEATAINNRGQIVGGGVAADGSIHAFLLTPTAVPEPGSFALVGLGALALLAAHRARRASIRP